MKLIGINSFGEFVRLSQSLSSRRCHSLIAGFLYPSPVAAIYSLCTTGRKQSTLSVSLYRRDEGLPTKKDSPLHLVFQSKHLCYNSVCFPVFREHKFKRELSSDRVLRFHHCNNSKSQADWPFPVPFSLCALKASTVLKVD